MSLLGIDRMTPSSAVAHRTRVHQVPTASGTRLWWWTCSRCVRHFGYGRSWRKVHAAAERHARSFR